LPRPYFTPLVGGGCSRIHSRTCSPVRFGTHEMTTFGIYARKSNEQKDVADDAKSADRDEDRRAPDAVDAIAHQRAARGTAERIGVGVALEGRSRPASGPRRRARRAARRRARRPFANSWRQATACPRRLRGRIRTPGSPRDGTSRRSRTVPRSP